MRYISSGASVVLVAVAWLVLVSTATAQTARTNTLESLRSTYDDASARISADLDKQRDDAIVQYGKALETVLIALKQKGDIDTYTLVDAERKRSQQDGTVVTNDPPLYVAEAVRAYQKQIALAKLDSERRTVDLLGKYIVALNKLVRDLMLQDKIEDAKAVAAVRDAADFELMDRESRLPKVKPQAATPVSAAVETKVKRTPPKNAKDHGGHHYLVVMEQKTWHGAKAACEEMGGHLVFIKSSQVNGLVKKLAGGKTVWLGCSDAETDGRWLWLDGSSVSYDRWARGEPNNRGPHGREDFGLMRSDGDWNDVDGSGQGVPGYVCEWDY